MSPLLVALQKLVLEGQPRQEGQGAGAGERKRPRPSGSPAVSLSLCGGFLGPANPSNGDRNRRDCTWAEGFAGIRLGDRDSGQGEVLYLCQDMCPRSHSSLKEVECLGLEENPQNSLQTAASRGPHRGPLTGRGPAWRWPPESRCISGEAGFGGGPPIPPREADPLSCDCGACRAEPLRPPVCVGVQQHPEPPARPRASRGSRSLAQLLCDDDCVCICPSRARKKHPPHVGPYKKQPQ